MTRTQIIPSPLWGGLGWGSLRILQFETNMECMRCQTPTPSFPTRGRGKIGSLLSEKLIWLALKELATG